MSIIFKDNIEKEKNIDNQKSVYIPYPYNRPGPKKNQKYPDIKHEIILRPFNFACQSVENLNKIQWSQIQALEITENYNHTLFIETDGGALILKGIQDVASDFFIYKLCKIMQISVPETRIVKFSDSEFQILVNQIQRAALCDNQLYQKTQKILDRPYLIITEYIPSISLFDMGKNRAQKIFGHLSLNGRDRLIKLGMILQFDLFINNDDRYPLVWDTVGNPDNIVVKVQTSYTSKSIHLKNKENLNMDFQDFYILNNKMNFYEIKSEEVMIELNTYYIKVQDFLNKVFMDLKRVMGAQIDPVYNERPDRLESLKKLVLFIQNYTGYELEEMQVLQVLIGIVNGCENFCQLGIDRIGILHHFMFIDPKDDYKDVWNTSLDMVNLEILADILNIFSKFRNVYSDVIGWVREMTLHQFHVSLKQYELAIGGEVLEQENEMKQIFDEYDQTSKKQQTNVKEEVANEFYLKDNDEEIEEKDNELNNKIQQLFNLDIRKVEQEAKEGKDVKALYIQKK